MSDLFLTRQLVQLALTANATRPIPGGPASVPAFFAGWLAAELAPQLAAATAVDVGVHAARHGLHRRADHLGVAAAAVSAIGYGSLIAAGQRALREALGEGYADGLTRPPEPADLATPWRQLAWPFRMRHVDVMAKRRLPYAPGGKRFELDVY